MNLGKGWIGAWDEADMNGKEIGEGVIKIHDIYP